MNYQTRFYRDYSTIERWKACRVAVDSTDLYIKSTHDLSDIARQRVVELRAVLNDHIALQGEFLYSYDPVTRINGVHPIIERMYNASEKTGVGPLAAVAGAIARETGRVLLEHTEEVIIENGGDLWLKVLSPAAVSVWPGGNYFRGISIAIRPDETPCGVCTSSGRLGRSFSFGRADAVTIISRCAALADAAATAVCNMVKDESCPEGALERAMSIDGVTGAMIVYGKKLALRGDIVITDCE